LAADSGRSSDPSMEGAAYSARRSRTEGFQAASRAPAKCHSLREGTSKGPGPRFPRSDGTLLLETAKLPTWGPAAARPRGRSPASRASSKASAGERLRMAAGRVVAFDMRGRWRRAKPAGSCPLDGRVRHCSPPCAFCVLPQPSFLLPSFVQD
jgi:hypothetical protein